MKAAEEFDYQRIAFVLEAAVEKHPNKQNVWKVFASILKSFLFD